MWRVSGILCMESTRRLSARGVYAPRKAKLVSFKSYYLRILAGGKPGFPTREEAQQDFRAMLADSMPIRYG